MTKKHTYIILVFLIVIFLLSFSEAAEIYYPYPIIFVHGINSNVSDWDYAKGEIEKYFRDGNGYKYPIQDSKQDYFPYCDYEWQNKGDIPSIAITSLKGSIDSALNSYPAEIPESERKVIIVAHSMGGLVTRSLLKQDTGGYYASKIDRVVFIGTPHLGSPWASSIWLLNKIRKEIITPAVNDYSTFYSQNTGSRFRFVDASSSLQINGLPNRTYDDLTGRLKEEKKALDAALSWPDEEGLSDSKALEQLRLNQDVTFKKILKSSSRWQIGEVKLEGSITGNQTFLWEGAQNLAIPSNFKVICGTNPCLLPMLQKIADWGVSPIYNTYNDNISFPPHQSLYDAMTTGDGIVTQLSQEGIDYSDYTVSSFHMGETGQYKAILLALEDAPVIESVRAVPVNWWRIGWKLDFQTNTWRFVNEQYVIIKSKDYFLADVEIDSIVIDGETVTLPDNFKGTDGKYKPYNAFGKDFLKSREDTSAPYRDMSGNMANLTLQPGEFWIKLDLADKNAVSIKIKNPAAAFDASKYTVEKTIVFSCPIIKGSLLNGISIGHWRPTYGIPTIPSLTYVGVLDIPPFDQSKPYYDRDGNAHYYDYYSEQTNYFLEIGYSSFSKIKFSVFTYIDYDDIMDGDIIKRVITNKEETLNPAIDTEGQIFYSKAFSNMASWDGSDDNGSYSYTSRINWYRSCYAPPRYSFGTIGSILVIEAIDDDPTDNLLPLTFSCTETLWLEK